MSYSLALSSSGDSPTPVARRSPAPQASLTRETDRLFEEIAYIAYHFHWSLDEILDLEHPLRRRFVDEIAQINRRLAEER